jgi:nucleotide-binding universal stress UspA family protein
MLESLFDFFEHKSYYIRLFNMSPGHYSSIKACSLLGATAFERTRDMQKVLVPVDGSTSSGHAIKDVIRRYQKNEPAEIHLLNVQPPLPRYITRFLSHGEVTSYRREQGARALASARALLDTAGIHHQHHVKMGDKVEVITRFAKLHHCDLIVMGSGRKSSYHRFLQSSLTNRVMAHTQVPVKIIPGDEPTLLERYGIATGTGIGIGLTLWLLATD